jgi:hypothetical protein
LANILQRLADEAKKKKDELVQHIAGAGAAPTPVQINTPDVVSAIQHAKYGRFANNPTAATNFLHTNAVIQQQNRPSLVNGLSNLGDAQDKAVMKTIVQPFITRPAAEISQTARQFITKKPSTYTPGSPMQKELFGNEPVASIQKKVSDQYQRQSTSGSAALRLASRPLAAAEGVVSVANDLPVIGSVTKGLIKGTAKAAPTVATVAENVIPKAAPVIRQVGKSAQEAGQVLDRGVVATTKAVSGNVKAANAKKSNVANYDATIADLYKQKSALQQRIRNTTNFRGVETTQRHIDQIDADIAQVTASKPKMTLKDKILAPNVGLGTQGVKKIDPVDDYHAMYGDALKQFDEAAPGGNKFKAEANGSPVMSGKSPFYRQFREATGKAPTKADYKEEAIRQLKSGKADPYAQEEYNAIGQPQAQAPLEIPTGFEAPTAPSTTPAIQSPDAAIPVQPPVSRETGAVSLPEYGTKRVSGLDKAFRSTRSVIERQGEHGQALAGELQKARDTEEIYQAQLSKQLPTVRSLKGKAFENFVEATQGKAQPVNAKVEQAVREWQAVHPGIRERAVNAGLDVGDLGPQYYPHFIDYEKVFKDKNTYNQAINHLVSTGQADSPEAAIKLLNYAKDVSRNRSFGNLEAQRLIDLPMYDKTPNSLVSYLQGSAHRIAQTEHFGAKDEKALKLIADAGQQGYDTEAMKEAYDVAVGAKRYGQTASNISRKARAFQSTTRLGLGAITNSSQNVNTGIVTGHLRTLGAMAKQLNPKTRSFVEDTGVIGDAVLNDIKEQSGFTGKVLGKITAPGFGKVENFNRSVAATAGRNYALRLAQTGKEDVLRKLGVTGEIKNKTLTEAQQIQAARKVVEKTQFKVDAQDLPGWTDSPGGKLVAQFRTFSYNQSKFFSNEILKPAAKGNMLPLGRLMAALPLGYALYETKRVINGRPEEENKTKKGLQAFQNVGGAGLAFDIYQSLNPTNSQYLPADRRVSMGVSTIGGPTAGLAAQGVGAVNDLIQRKNTPTDTSRLDGKLVVGNNGKTYTDATQAGRFALNQIPVFGSPIRNRVLPYKAQSQADTGSSKVTAGTSKDTKATISAAFSTPEAKVFMKLTDAEKKQAAQSDPNARALYDQYQAMKTGLKQNTTLRASGLSADSTKTLNRIEKLTTQGKDNYFANHPDAEYQYKAAQYENDKLSGKLTKTEEIKRQNELAKAKVGSKYSKDVRDLYSLSKSDLYDFLTSDPNGQTYADQLKAYDNSLKDSGIISKAKFKNGFNTSTGANGTGKSLSTLLAEFKLPGADDLKNRSKAASLARNAHLAKKS